MQDELNDTVRSGNLRDLELSKPKRIKRKHFYMFGIILFLIFLMVIY